MADESPELIEHEMEHTRQSLTDKVAALEQQVTGTIQSAASTVKETVESVKTAMQDTVTSVKDTVTGSVESVSEGIKNTFDINHHVRENPWVAVGTAAAAGFVTGLFVFRGSNARSLYGEGLAESGSSSSTLTSQTPRASSPSSSPSYASSAGSQPARSESSGAGWHRPSWVDDLLDMFGQEAKKLGQQAIASLSASVKQNLEHGVPKLLDNVMDKFQGQGQPAHGGAAGTTAGATSHQTPGRPGPHGPHQPATGV